MLGSNDTPKRPTRAQSLDTLQSSASSKKTDVSPMGSSKKSSKAHRRGSTGPSDGSAPVSRRSSLKHGSRGSPVPPRRSSLSSSKRNVPAPMPDFDADINDSEEKDDHDSLPDLVEDVIVRWQMVGHRGGKEWNIQEDTPAGHAEEKLTIVVAIESDNESVISRNWYAGDEHDDDDDDDTIHDIPDDQSYPPLRNRNSLPSDPSSAQGSVPTQDLSVRDRFDPSFNDVDMWSKDVHVDQIKFRSTRSADRSILSECHSSDYELISELGNSEVLDLDQRPHTPDDYRETLDIGGGTTASKTPATFKQSGSRRLTKMHHAPTLDVLSHDAAGSHPESVPEDGLLDGTSDHQVPRRTNKSGRSERKGSHSTGRSSYNRTRKDRDPMRGRRQQGKVPSTVPATPSVDEKVRSPLSSSLASTPNSISLLSSLKSQQQHQSLESLRLRHSKPTSSPKGRPRPLNLHVGREEFSPSDGDDYTLGASTITTNFSTTQRTRGDNTVSTRSLFQSERMHISESLRIPQRASEETGLDDQGGNAKFLPPVQPRRSIDNHLLEGQDMADFVRNLEESIDASADSLPSSPVGDPNRSILRRPSGADDELLPEVGTHVSPNQAQLSPVPRNDDTDEADELNRLSGERFENSPVSPSDSRRSKKKNRLGLFRMKQGWQMGAVKLEDDEEEA